MDLVERTKQIAAKARGSREEMRERYPFVAEMVDWASAGEAGRGFFSCVRFEGREWGKRVPDAKPYPVPFTTCGVLGALQAKHGGRRW